MMSNLQKNIFIYWDDKPNSQTPDYILMCRETIKKNKGEGIKLNIINKDNLSDYLNDIPENLFKLKEIAHIADYVRVALLVKYGGIWLDSDCILLKDLNPIFDKLKRYDYVGYSWGENEPSLGFMASIKDCEILKEHLANIRQKIDTSKTFNFNWSGLGYDSLWPITRKKPEKTFLFKHTYFSPINWQFSVSEFTGNNKNLIPKDCYCVMLFNKMFSRTNIKNLKKDEILSQENLLSYLFKKGLKKD